MHRKYHFITILSTLFYAGCATNMPVSEGLVFSEYDAVEVDSFSDKISGTISEGVSYIFPSESLKTDSLNTINKEYLYALPMPSFSVSYTDKISLGSTVPLLMFWQVDGTVRLIDDYFLTLSKKVYSGNTEIILQKKIKDQENGGINLGVFYRSDGFQLSEGESFSFDQTFYVPWFGVRSVIQTPIKIAKNLNFRAYINGGYSMEYESMLASFGFSIVFDSGGNKMRRI
ncbi:MAG: hypothetical protein U5K71_01065 [Gracilimonas sp.]|nr:hypothetical protein [Gracilimonas sp.]